MQICTFKTRGFFRPEEACTRKFLYEVHKNVNTVHKNKFKKKNGRQRKSISAIKSCQLKILICNVVSPKSKINLFDKLLNYLFPSLFSLQETHLKKGGKIKFN